MNIYLIRHGKAEPASLKKDKERELTDEGITIINQSVEMWKKRVSHFDFIITSPVKRAVQTAEIIAEYITCQNQIIKDNLLGPGGSTASIIQLAVSLDGKNIAFVGHQPDMSFHISRLACNSEMNLKFSPASIAHISFEGKPKAGKGKLIFLLPPIK
jgi:phosphohistidine phosphatase